LTAGLDVRMSYRIRYHFGEKQIGDAESASSLEEAHRLIGAKLSDLSHRADLAIIFRISPSGVEELEESRNLHSVFAKRP
jgi:hypothetical protein